MKTCFKCGVEKPLGEFYAHKAMADGHLNKCKTCTRTDVTRHRNDNLERIRAYDRGRGKLEHRRAANREQHRLNPAAHRAANQAYLARFPEKKAAHIALNNAVRDGRVIKLPCEVCGDPNSEGHHDDYSKPLDIRWLCDTHHKEHHNNERENNRRSVAA